MKCPFCENENSVAVTEEYKKAYNKNLILLILIIITIILMISINPLTGGIIGIIITVLTQFSLFFVKIFRGNKTRTKATCLNCHKKWYI